MTLRSFYSPFFLFSKAPAQAQLTACYLVATGLDAIDYLAKIEDPDPDPDPDLGCLRTERVRLGRAKPQDIPSA